MINNNDRCSIFAERNMFLNQLMIQLNSKFFFIWFRLKVDNSKIKRIHTSNVEKKIVKQHS